MLTAALLGCAGCGRGDDDKITVYRIPKEAPATPPMEQAAMGAPPAGAPMAAAARAVHWTAPAGWQEQPASGFRKGSFRVAGTDGKSADISVISFPKQAGGVLANVNRWRNQLKLAPITSDADVGTPMTVASRDMFFVDLVSAPGAPPDGAKTRILGGIYPLPDETWFFKMTGPDQVVEAQREAFKQFLNSVHPDEAAPAPMPMTAANDAEAGKTNAPTPPPIEPAQGAPLQFAAPPGWHEKPLSTMRLASFDAPGPNGKKADVSVVALPGMAGGELANVNRWRDQMKLGPIDEGALQQQAEHLKANGHDYLLVNIPSEAAVGNPPTKQRIIAAILNENDRAWFIKMTGDDAAVAANQEAFADFVRSLKIP